MSEPYHGSLFELQSSDDLAQWICSSEKEDIYLKDVKVGVKQRWHYAPSVPIILVGTKLDLRDDKKFFDDHPGAVPITTAQGEELKKLIGAPAYIECSSKTQQRSCKILLQNVKAVFDAAIKVVLQPPKQKKKKKRKSQKGCSIL